MPFRVSRHIVPPLPAAKSINPSYKQRMGFILGGLPSRLCIEALLLLFTVQYSIGGPVSEEFISSGELFFTFKKDLMLWPSLRVGWVFALNISSCLPA